MTSQVVRKHERVGRVVLWLRAVCGGVVFGHERINSRMNIEWSWTYEHVRTGVGLGLNVLGGGVLVHSCRSRN